MFFNVLKSCWFIRKIKTIHCYKLISFITIKSIIFFKFKKYTSCFFSFITIKFRKYTNYFFKEKNIY